MTVARQMRQVIPRGKVDVPPQHCCVIYMTIESNDEDTGTNKPLWSNYIGCNGGAASAQGARDRRGDH